MEKLSSFISWKLLKIALQNEKCNPQITAIRDFFLKIRGLLSSFWKRAGEPPPSTPPPPSHVPSLPLVTRLLYKNLTFSFTLRLLKSEILHIFHQVFLLPYFLLELIVIVGYITWNMKHKTWNFRFARCSWRNYSVTSCTVPLIFILSQFIGNSPLFFFEIAWL